MQNVKATKNKLNGFSEQKATSLFLIKGEVHVDDYFISELKKALKNKQNETIFSFTVGVSGPIYSAPLIQELQDKYNCSINSNHIGGDLLGLSGEFIINKNEVSDKIIELQNFCKKNSVESIEFSIMI